MESNIKRGALAGILAGAVIGITMYFIASGTPAGNRVIMMQLVDKLTTPTGTILGWAYHLFECAVMGAVFGALVGRRIYKYQEGFRYGSLYGLAWWILGGVFLMPIFLGTSFFAPQALEPIQPLAIQSLIGHVFFGLILGGIFIALQSRSTRGEVNEVRTGESKPPRLKAG